MRTEVRYFKTFRGDEPVADYLDSLPAGDRAGLRSLTDLLEEQGYLYYPDGRKMGGTSDLWELRFKKHRIFYSYIGGVVILLHAFRKQSRKTPQKELETAMNRIKLLKGEAI